MRRTLALVLLAATPFAPTLLAQSAAKPAAAAATPPAAAPAAEAISPERRAKATELVDLAKVSDLNHKYIMQLESSMRTSISEQAQGMQFNDAQKKLLADYQTNLATMMADTLAWDKVKPGVVDLYARTYSVAEMDGIIAFYKSPAGQTFLAKQPDLSQGTIGVMQESMKSMQPKVQAASQKFGTDMQAAATPDPTALPAPKPATPGAAPATAPKPAPAPAPAPHE